MRFRWTLLAIAYSVIMFPTGCSQHGAPGLASVTGTVTLDGAPLANAFVVFSPKDSTEKPSRAYTDSDGHYELTYLRDMKGAVVGEHTVRITTATENRPQEILPARYNSRTELEVTVKPGSNDEVDFNLTSQNE